MTIHARIGLLAIVMSSGCGDWATAPQYCEGEAVAAEPEASSIQNRVVAQVLPTESSAVDILFVVDDSMSMMDEQEQLGIWSSELFSVLSGSGELPDLHIAVTSSSVAIPALENCQYGLGGSLHVGAATLQYGQFIRDVAGPEGRERNYEGTLNETFAKMARVGNSGCGLEQPFRAAEMALSNYGSGTKGFLREDALLLVVFVTDEDDCSASDPTLFTDPYADACSELGVITSYRCFEHGVKCHDGKGARAFGERRNCRPDDSSPYVTPVSGFAEFLKSLKQHPGQVIVAGIYGKPHHVKAIPDERVTWVTTPRLANVCGTTGAEGTGATPAIRMNGLMAEFGGRASQSSICESELSWAMRDVGLVTRGAAKRSPCLRGALFDADKSAMGIQPACRVEVASDVATDELPACPTADGARCFTVEVDAACAETATKMAVRVPDLAADETVTVRCDVDVDAPEPQPASDEHALE